MPKLSRLYLALVMIVGKKNQAWVARQLDVNGPKMSLILRGDRSLTTVDEECERAFMADFPILDALLPSGWEKDVSIDTNVAGAMAIAKMAAAALAGAASDRERWVFRRLAAKAELQAGVDYNFDEQTGSHQLMVSHPRLQRASEHFRALENLCGILPHREEVVHLAVKQNLLAVDMLREKAAGSIKPTSSALHKFRQLLDELALVYVQRLPEFARWAAEAATDEAENDDEDKIGLCASEQVMRLLITYSAAATAELSLEIEDRQGALDALVKATQALGDDYKKLLKIVFVEMAWAHNKPAYLELFGMSRPSAPESRPSTH